MARKKVDVTKVLKRQRPIKPTEIPDRCAFVFQFYHQKKGQDPFYVDIRTSNPTELKEEPLRRHVSVPTGKGIVLDLAWMKDKTGMLVLHCLDLRKNHPVTLTKEEQADLSRRVVEVYHTSDKPMLIRPGKFMVFEPTTEVQLVSQYETAEVMVYAIPR